MSKVPNASFEDATDVIGLVRYVKSEEEIASCAAQPKWQRRGSMN